MDPDPGGPKTCGSGGSGSGTLIVTIFYSVTIETESHAILSFLAA